MARDNILKYISVFSVFLLLFISLTSFSFASSDPNSTANGYWAGGVFYSPMSEPISNDHIVWFGFASGEGRHNWLNFISVPAPYKISANVFPSAFDEDGDGEPDEEYYHASCTITDLSGNLVSSPVYVYSGSYDLLTGECIRFNNAKTTSQFPYTFTLSFPWGPVSMPLVYLNGVSYNGSPDLTNQGTNSPDLMRINWMGASERGFFADTFPSFANQVNYYLSEIQTSSALSRDDIHSILYFLTDVVYPFLLGFEDKIDSNFDDVLSRLDSLIQKVTDIYNGLFGEGEDVWTTDPVFEESVDDLIGAEEELTQDLEGGIGNVIRPSDVDSALEGHSNVFAFFSDSMNKIVLSQPSVYALVIYALILGIVVMLIGRRIYV